MTRVNKYNFIFIDWLIDWLIQIIYTFFKQGYIELIKGSSKDLSEGSSDTKDWKFNFAITGINYILNYFKIETAILHFNNILLYIYISWNFTWILICLLDSLHFLEYLSYNCESELTRSREEKKEESNGQQTRVLLTVRQEKADCGPWIGMLFPWFSALLTGLIFGLDTIHQPLRLLTIFSFRYRIRSLRQQIPRDHDAYCWCTSPGEQT